MILIDENSSSRLVRRLADLFPGIQHVEQLHLTATDYLHNWETARILNATILTTDRDFAILASRQNAPPPKVIWLERWDYGTAHVEQTLRRKAIRIAAFLTNDKLLITLKRAD